MKAGRIVLVAVAVIGCAGIARADGNEEPWLAQIGVTQQIQLSAKSGAGVTIGIVDTGIDLANPAFAGRISSASGCAAVTFACSNGAQDDNGHGTAIADVAAGAGIGIASGSTIVAEKVLDATGTGETTDVANGIAAAASAGAKVINVSISWSYGDTAVPAAINTAAGAHATTVYAGGNDFGSPMLGYAGPMTGWQAPQLTGLTAQSLSYLVFVGSVGPNNVLSSFSAIPGNGVVTVNTGSGTITVPLASLWLVAPGENVPSPGDYGTSGAAPQVTGALALLEARWPILASRGTATSLLFATATDLGAPGVDPIYGNGLLNVARAFQPVGAVSIPVGATGVQSVSAASLTGGFSAGGALGSLTNLANALGRVIGFDSYSRDFPINLANMIGKPATSPVQALASPTGATSAASVHFADGGSVATLVTSWSVAGDYGVPHFAGAPPMQLPGIPDRPSWISSLTEADGSVLTSGYGYPPVQSLTSAMWGARENTAGDVGALGISTSLLGLAAGGPFTSYGAGVGTGQRIALSLAHTAPTETIDTGFSQPSATAAAAGYRVRISDDWAIGFTAATLAEQQGLLGTTYVGSASLGAAHTSGSIGFTSSHTLGGGFDLVFDAGWARADGASLSNSVISGVSALSAWGAGASLAKNDLVDDGDRLSVTVRRPLQVYSGTASVGIGTVDAATGAPGFQLTRVGLAPAAPETDAMVGYDAPITDCASWRAMLETRADADGVPHVREDLVQLGLNISF